MILDFLRLFVSITLFLAFLALCILGHFAYDSFTGYVDSDEGIDLFFGVLFTMIFVFIVYKVAVITVSILGLM
jgi:hypothetical protein